MKRLWNQAMQSLVHPVEKRFCQSSGAVAAVAYTLRASCKLRWNPLIDGWSITRCGSRLYACTKPNKERRIMSVDPMTHSECSCLLREGFHCLTRSLSKLHTGRSVCGKKVASCGGANPSVTLCRTPSIAMSRLEGNGAKRKCSNASTSLSFNWRKKRRCTQSTDSSTFGDAWYIAGVELST